MEENIYVQWRGFVVEKSQTLTDSQVLEYRFRNIAPVGSGVVIVNGIILQAGQEFNENLPYGQTSYGDYKIVIPPAAGQKGRLLVSTKVQVKNRR